MGAAHGPPSSARGARAVTAALCEPRRLPDRLHRPRRQPVRASRGHIRRDDRVLHRALALGYNAPRYHLLRYRTPERQALYGSVLGPLVRQRPVLDAVAEGRADVAAIDGWALDLLRRHAPEVAARVRVIATTVPAPSAPLVASPGTSEATCRALTDALVEAHTRPELRPTLDALLLSRFVRVAPPDFDVFLERQRAAEAAGYAKLA
ncbi:MAG TPA: PhnD/SsuA/transferrin family substrate-binding protein [Methylomirabilota bacterium]